MNNFSELTLSSVLRANLDRNCFTTPTPVQAQAIPPALEGRDIVATAQTGTGKTLAFVLPLLESLLREPLEKGIAAVVLSPTRELALQIDEVFRTLAAGTGIRSAAVVGGLNEQRQLLAIRQGAQVLIATPGRLCDFLGRRLVKLQSVRVLVLDEADRMLDMGFLPSIEEIIAPIPATRQTLFFSATIEPSVKALIGKYLNDPVRISIGSTTKPAEQIDLHAYEVEQDRKLGLLQHLLAADPGSFLVFARTKHGADRLARKLSRTGLRTASIHGDRTQSQRNQALRSFQNGDCRVLVATDVAARGIHVDGISHVVNYDLPQVPEDFIHRVGRTGRAGARGVASTFATRGERGEIRRIERTLKTTLTKLDVSPDILDEATIIAALPEHPRTPPPPPARAHNPAKSKPTGFRFSGPKTFKPRPAAGANTRVETRDFTPTADNPFGPKAFKPEHSDAEPRRDSKPAAGAKPFGPKSFKPRPADAEPRREFKPAAGAKPFGPKPFKPRPADAEPRREFKPATGKKPFGAKPFAKARSAEDGPRGPKSFARGPFTPFSGPKSFDKNRQADGESRGFKAAGAKPFKPKFAGSKPKSAKPQPGAFHTKASSKSKPFKLRVAG